MDMDKNAVFTNIVRLGRVSSVDTAKRTARIAFNDRLDSEGKPLISAPLKIIQNQPLITVEKWVEELGSEEKWDYSTEYNSHDRGLALGESYVQKSYEEMKDVIKNEKIIEIENKKNRQTVTVYPWLPYIGQYVVCLFLPNGESDGFVLGGI